MCHFIAIGQIKLELQSGITQFGSKSTIFFSHVTLKFDGWHWKTIGHLFYVASSFVQHFIAICEIKLELQFRNAQFASKSTIFCPLMALKNNRAHLLCYFQLCATFHSHLWNQTGVTVRKSPNWNKICFDLCDLDLWPLTLTLCTDITFVNSNNFMMMRWKEHGDKGAKGGQTDGQKCS